MTAHIKAWNRESGSYIGGHCSLEALGSCKNGRLLDAGCGCGKYAIPLRTRGFDVVAMDVSTDALKLAGKRGKGRKLDLKLLAGNVFQLPFPDCSFDAIWCYGVLQHLLLKERELAVSEFWRVLEKGGVLFIEVFGREDMRYGGSEIEPDTFCRKNGTVYHYFNKSELEDLFKNFLCTIVESRKEKRFDGVWYTRHMISAFAKKI